MIHITSINGIYTRKLIQEHSLRCISSGAKKLNENKIFYLHCDNCRNKIKLQKNKKNNELNNYNNIKHLKKIECICGKKYIAFRDYHIQRHEISNYHIKNISNNK